VANPEGVRSQQVTDLFPLAAPKRPYSDAFRANSSNSDDENINNPNKIRDLMQDLTLYRKKDSDGEVTRVMEFTSLFMPDNKKRRDLMYQYNKNKVAYPSENWVGEGVRAEKRLLKENYKKCMAMHSHKAKHLPVNVFMEDFY
jgi:hypothetical protein